ncbi:MAG: TolC family protein [Verrucomicrobiota bacterium]|jgi:outer membrane protein
MTKVSQNFAGAVFLGLAFAIANAEDAPRLTLQEAHEAALRSHPQISVADLKALAARQVTRQFRSGFFPNLSGNVMSVGTANENTRLAAIGGLNNPSIFDRNAEGLVLSQLITDFGRTANLTGSAKLRAQAEANNAQATREQILLAVDGAFFAAQQAQSVTRVAEETVAERQVFLAQVSALASNKLRSDLDVSFARVNVEDGKLLLSKAQNDLQAAFAQLANLMGLREPKTYRLVEQPLPPELSTNVAQFVEQALQSRPDLLSLRNSQEAAFKFARAEKALRYPNLSAIGSAGVIPIGDSELPKNYAAAGLSLTLPLYAGGFYSARQQEAELRARAADEGLRDLEDNVIRDVRIAWLNAQNAFDRLRITAQLVDNAKQSFDLAEARYSNGISSIVEFNQAQLNLLSAQIAYANTQYEYLLQRSALDFQTGSLH